MHSLWGLYDSLGKATWVFIISMFVFEVCLSIYGLMSF